MQKELSGFPADFFLHDTELLANSVPKQQARQTAAPVVSNLIECSILHHSKFANRRVKRLAPLVDLNVVKLGQFGIRFQEKPRVGIAQ